uniref:Uncharacterized protein n=1 Tax=Romanomermis culicivorax TaxID=13658 RepID=A0A915IMX7_ROMCU
MKQEHEAKMNRLRKKAKCRRIKAVLRNENAEDLDEQLINVLSSPKLQLFSLSGTKHLLRGPPLEADGVDAEIDLMATERQFEDPASHQHSEHHFGRRLSETLSDFAEKVGEGARRISESIAEDGQALAGVLSSGAPKK